MKPIHLYLIGILGILGACSKEPSSAPVSRELPELQSITLAASPVAQEIKFDGVIEAVNQATVSAQTTGRVVELPVDVGDYVNKGDLIVRITDTEQKARVASAQAKFNEAKSNYERMQDMLAKQLIAKADFDKAESMYKSAAAALREAEEGAARTAIYAPYAGIVVSRMIKVGETVAPGTPLMSGLSLEHLRAQVNIPQQHIGPVRKFKKARIQLNDDNFVETSDIRIPPSADEQTHSFKVLVNLPQGDYKLFPGTLIKVAFVSGETQRLSVPESAISQRGEVSAVYVLRDDAIELRMVRLGTKTVDNRYPVLSGLTEGELIASDPIAAAAAYKKLSSSAHKLAGE